MGLIKRMLHVAEEPEDAPCPRCGTPAPAREVTCGACGWDLREAFHGAYAGSHLGVEDRDVR